MRFKDNLIAIQEAMLPNTAPNAPFWKGYLTAYKLNDDGTLPTDANQLIDQTQIVKYWEASEVLDGMSPDDRKMYITVYDSTDPDWKKWGYKMIDFKPDSRVYNAIRCPGGIWILDGTKWVLSKFPDVNQDGAVNSADCAAFVNLLRGNNAFNWGSKLGDLFHSQPVVVGSPSPTFVDTTFDPANPLSTSPRARPPAPTRPSVTPTTRGPGSWWWGPTMGSSTPSTPDTGTRPPTPTTPARGRRCGPTPRTTLPPAS